MNPRYHALSVVLICGVAVPGQALAGSGKGNCQDIPLQLTISPVQSDGSGYPGIYGDAGPDSTTVYTDSRGVYAKFQVCNGTNDFILNVGRPSTRFFTVDFSRLLAPGDSGAVQPTGPVSAWFINLDHAAISTGNSAWSLDTLMNVSTSGAGGVLYCGPQQPSYAAFGLPCMVVDKYSDTSLVRVTVAPSCGSWTITPVPLPAGTFRIPRPSASGGSERARPFGRYLGRVLQDALQHDADTYRWQNRLHGPFPLTFSR